MKKVTKLPEQPSDPASYQNLIEFLAILSDTTDDLNLLQTELNKAERELIDEHRDKLVEYHERIAKAELAIEQICRAHPDWFEKVKTLKTPYGQCSFRKSSELNAPSEDASISLIKASGRAKDFLRTSEELDLEALEKLSDAELAAFGIIRREERKFSVKPARVDVGKAAVEAAKEVKVA